MLRVGHPHSRTSGGHLEQEGGGGGQHLEEGDKLAVEVGRAAIRQGLAGASHQDGPHQARVGMPHKVQCRAIQPQLVAGLPGSRPRLAPRSTTASFGSFQFNT